MFSRLRSHIVHWRTARVFAALLLTCALDAALFPFPAAAAATTGADAWKNTTAAWGGTLNGTNAAYAQGLTIPSRLVITGESAGVHTLDIMYDFLDSSAGSNKHFMDFIESFDRTLPRSTADPCAGVTGCSGNPTTLSIPSDVTITNQRAGVLSVWNASGLSLGAYTTTSGGGAIAKHITLIYTATAGANVVVAFGAHISSPSDWGIGNGASSWAGGSGKVGGTRDGGTEKVVGINPGAFGVATNTAPIVASGAANVNQNSTTTVTLSASDAENCELTFRIVSAPTHGTLGAIGNQTCAGVLGAFADSASLTYTPTAGYSGSDSFTWTANDGTTDGATATVSVTVSPAASVPQTITFAQPTSPATYGTTFTVSPIASSGLVVSIVASGGCTKSGATVTMTSGATDCTLVASQSGDATYAPAPDVTRTVGAAKASQTITFAQPSSPATYGSSFTVGATASSTLGTTISASGGCSISGATVTMTSGAIDCVLAATQAGDSNYAPAPSVSRTVIAARALLTLTATDRTRVYGASEPAFDATLSGFVNGETVGTSGMSGSASCTTTALPASDPGNYPISCTQGTLTATNYDFGTFVSGTLAVTQAPATVTLGDLVQTYDGTPRAVTVTTAPNGLGVTITYTGTGATTYGPSTTAPTASGSYAVSATIFDIDYTGTATGTLVVSGPAPSPTPAPTPTPTPTPTASPTTTPSPAPTAAPTPTVAPTATPVPTPTATPTGTPTATPTPTAAPTASPTSTSTPSPAPTAAPTPTPTGTPASTATPLPTASPSSSPVTSPTPTATVAPTASSPVAPTSSPAPAAVPMPTPTSTSTPAATPNVAPAATLVRRATPAATVAPSSEPTSVVSTESSSIASPSAAPTATLAPSASTATPSTTAPSVTRAPDVTSSATTTVSALGGESLGGFAPRSPTLVRVSGSRTVAMFVLPRVSGALDTAAILASLNDSAARQALGYARITNTRASSAPADVIAPIIDSADLERFAAEQLPGVEALDADGLTAAGTWLMVEVNVEQYVPGSRVYLVITSEPLVIDSALVSADGGAHLAGAVPLELLGEGAHRLRVVGSRQLAGIVVNDKGEVAVPYATLREIETFDHGTTAVVEITGLQQSGASRSIVRYIPLRGEFPWWLLLAVGLADLGAAILHRRGHLDFASRRWLTLAGIAAAAASASWLGWTGLWPETVLASTLLFIPGALLVIRGRARSLGVVASRR